MALALASGGLDPVGFAYYGAGAEWRMPVLLLLLAALQLLWIGDAIILGRRLKRVSMWMVLIVGALIGPFITVAVLGQLDGWRYDHRSALANVGVGVMMILVLVSIYSGRGRLLRKGMN